MLTREGSSPFVRTTMADLYLPFYFVRIEIIIAVTVELHVFLPLIVLFSVVT